MEEQFVPYELALKLKELEFNEPCFYWYGRKDKLISLQKDISIVNDKFKFIGSKVSHICTAPLWQQAFDWCLKKLKKTHYLILIQDESNFGLDLIEYGQNYNLVVNGDRLTCLKKLIELIVSLIKY